MNDELFLLLFFVLAIATVLLMFICIISWIKTCRKVHRVIEEIKADIDKYL